jgi:peptide/nickel transport system ATP-binding protein
MYLGKIMEIGPAEAVIRSPHNPYTQALVSVSPSPEPPTDRQRAKRTILVGETPDAAHIPPGCRFHPRCPYAFDRCRVEEPPLFDVGGGQSAACWLAEGGRALPVLPPRELGEVVAPGVAADVAAAVAARSANGAPAAAPPSDGGTA